MILGRADAVTRSYILWLAFSLLMASTLAYFIAKYGIHERLARVIAVAQRVGKGDLKARTGLENTGGSLGALAAAIDDMAASLGKNQVERDMAGQEIIRQKMLLDSVLEGASDAIFVKDAQGRYLLANSEVARVVGKTVADIIGRDDTALFPQAEATAIMANDQSVMHSGQTSTFQETLSTAQGEFTYLTIKGPLRNSLGALTGIFGISRDITEQLRIQALMLQTEKMMSVGGLAAGMAHEINNPLSGILLNVQVLIRRLTLEIPANITAATEAGCSFDAIRRFMVKREVLAALDSIREAGTRAARIVTSMLEFSRKATSNPTLADMNVLLDKTLELCATNYDLKKKYDFRSIRIRRHYAPDLPLVPCMETQVQQVFMNIMTNAAQALAGTPSPVMVLRTMTDGDRVRIDIEDNGPGMDEDVRKHIFEPFFTTKGTGEGTGLGLSVSYFIIVNHHRGTVEVQSAPGKGSTFSISLPLEQNPALPGA